VGGQHITEHVDVDASRRHRGIGGAMAATGARGEAEMGDAQHHDRRAESVDEVEQCIGARGEAVVHLVAEPAKFTLVSTTVLGDTTTNGHLVLPEKIRLFSQSDQVAVPRQSLNGGTNPSSDV
jgi:hypothetical protein